MAVKNQVDNIKGWINYYQLNGRRIFAYSQIRRHSVLSVCE